MSLTISFEVVRKEVTPLPIPMHSILIDHFLKEALLSKFQYQVAYVVTQVCIVVYQVAQGVVAQVVVAQEVALQSALVHCHGRI